MSDKLKGGVIAGSTDLSIPVILRKTTDNKELTGVLDASLLCSYVRQGGVRVSIALTSLAAGNSAHADGGWVELGSLTVPGLYRLDVPDAAVASGADWVVVAAMPNGATSGYLWVQEYTLTGDPALAGFAASIADAVWDEAYTDHRAAGTFGLYLDKGVPKNTAWSDFTFGMVDSTDHRTPKTGLTITAYVGKDGAAFGAIAGTVTEISNGIYQLDAAASARRSATCDGGRAV